MWFWYGLLTAALSGVSVILNKQALKKVGAPLVSWSLFALTIPLILPIAFRSGIPTISSIVVGAIFVSSVAFVLAKTISLDSIQKSVLSHIYPLTSFNSLFTYLFGLAILSEKIKFISFMGLIVIIFGSYILKIDEAKEDVFKPFKLLFTNKASFIFLIGTVLASASGIFDKVALINLIPSNPILILLLENCVMSILLTFYMVRKDTKWVVELKQHFWLLFGGGVVYTLLALAFFYGSIAGPVVLVGGVKKLEIFVVLLMSWFLFGDKPTKYAWIGSVIMLLGVVLIKIA